MTKFKCFFLLLFVALTSNVFGADILHGASGRVTKFHNSNEINHYLNGNPETLFIQYTGGATDIGKSALIAKKNGDVAFSHGVTGRATIFENTNEFNHYSNGSPETLFIQYRGGDTNLGKNALIAKADGNVLIGTTIVKTNDSGQAYKLTVKGGIAATDIRVRPSAWFDNVFEDTYNLMPLTELKTTVKQTRHLPGIPSEKEVLEKGVSVAEMQGKLLQKIEELTLYMIDQNEKMVSQQGMIEFQSKEIQALKDQINPEKLASVY